MLYNTCITVNRNNIGVTVWKDPGYGDLNTPHCYLTRVFAILLKVMWIIVPINTIKSLLECTAICCAVVCSLNAGTCFGDENGLPFQGRNLPIFSSSTL
jgi:hypothetical protein